MAAQDTVWELPEPLSTHEVSVDDETIVILRRHGNPDGVRLILSHGNGLAIDLYYPFWSLLLDDFDLIIYDLRNHGWNGVSPLDRHNVPTLVEDHDRILEEIDRHYGKKPQFGVFHSVSGLVTLLSPARGSGFSGLLLFDPPLCKPGRSHAEFEASAHRLAGLARRRTERFKTREDFSGVLPLFPPFKLFAPGVFDLMARTVLREGGDGTGYELRCPRDYEAQLIDYASVFAVAVDFESLRCPVKVVGADPTVPSSYLPTLDLSDLLIVDYDFLPEATHFLTLEKPGECASATRQFLQQITAG